MTESNDTSKSGPTIGNILGFSLLFRDRKALLTLERRSLRPGVRLTDYEAEIPGVEFPLSGPLSAVQFRQRRCRTVRARLTIQHEIVHEFLRARWIGPSIAGLVFHHLELDLRGAHGPTMVLEGRCADGATVWSIIRLRLVPDQGLLIAAPTVQLVGLTRTSSTDLVRGLAQRLAPFGSIVAGGVRIDIARVAIARAFAAAGWKAPDTSTLVMRELLSSKAGMAIEWQSAGPEVEATPEPSVAVDELDGRLEVLRDQLLLDRFDERALQELETSARDTTDRWAKLILWRWLADLTRFTDRDRCIRATRGWLAVEPNNLEARKHLAMLLAVTDEPRALVDELAISCELMTSPRRRARLELALATLMLERLRDPSGALPLLERVVDRIRDDSALDELLPTALAAMTKARAIAEPGQAGSVMTSAREAAAQFVQPRERVRLLAEVADALAAAGNTDHGLVLGNEARREAEMARLPDVAMDLALKAGDIRAAADLVSRLESTGDSQAPNLAARLAEALLDRGDAEATSILCERLAAARERTPWVEKARRRCIDALFEQADENAIVRISAWLADADPREEWVTSTRQRLVDVLMRTDGTDAAVVVLGHLRQAGEQEPWVSSARRHAIDRLVTKGDFASLSFAADELNRIPPTSADDWSLTTAIDVARKLLAWDRAAELLEKRSVMLPAGPARANVLLERMECLLAIGRTNDVWRSVGEVIAHGPLDPTMRGRLVAGAVLTLPSDPEPHDRETLETLAAMADQAGDDSAKLRIAEAQLRAAANDQERAAHELALARAAADRGEIPAAISRLRDAASRTDPGSALLLEIAEAWLDAVVAVDPGERLNAEAEARATLRRALGQDLSPLDLRTEAMLLAELGRTSAARSLLEQGLDRHPTHELLLSAYKELSLAHGEPEHYVARLERAVSDLTAGELRDRLAIELAYAAMDREDAAKAMRALDHVSIDRAASPELLDLRDWAVQTLGLEQDERERLETRLLAAPTDGVLIQRLARVIGDDRALAATLMRLVTIGGPVVAAGVIPVALELACDRLRDPGLVVRTLRTAIDCGVVHDVPWERCEDVVLAFGEDGMIADFVLLLDTGERTGRVPVSGRAELLLVRALVAAPGSHHLHRAAWTRISADLEHDQDRIDAATTFLDRLADRHDLDPGERLALRCGLADLVDRRQAAELLRTFAESYITDVDTFAAAVSALQDRNHWPEVLRLLERRTEIVDDPGQRVAALKQLAHVCGDVLNDPGTAIRCLEEALELSPTDPDLLLSLLDHQYARTELQRAVELTIRVLDHVPMGDAAFASLAHRAADAALARNDLQLARRLLERVAERMPRDEKTRTRLDEVAALAGDPAHRVGLLAMIANRQGGSSRLEALEERARLLVDPLGRIDEAIEDLRTVLAEDPDRDASAALLADLYVARSRWTELVALLEQQFPRRHGTARSETLGRIAAIYRDHLYDLPRAEQALRLALENLGQPPQDRDVAEHMRADLVRCLEHQGRYVDLAVYLERELTDELEAAPDAAIHPARIDLLVQLAHVHRDFLDDEIKAARIYERLERLGRLPDEGLLTLARWYRGQQRHADLVRVLTLRSRALGRAGETERKAEVDHRIAEILEGPLARPHEAADFWLDAYLADPRANRLAGSRARMLLSGTDSVTSVRRRITERLGRTEPQVKPALLALLGDILAPQEEFEREAEKTYRQALGLEPEFAPAHEGLGRLLARQGRLIAAVEPLCTAARSLDIEPERAAEDAAIAARALFELGRRDEAERILLDALARAPDAQRALLELARLYHRCDRPGDEREILDQLSELPLSSMLKAEVAYRRAMLLEPDFKDDVLSPAGERARVYLLEAVSADANHIAARQLLMDLSHRRKEWSVVAHMHYLAIRELPPGPERALVHLDLAETYLDHLNDVESALRNIESAIQQAAADVVVTSRIGRMIERIPSPRRAAERFEHIAAGDNDLDDTARARLWLLAADLRMQEDDVAAAEAASQQVLALPGAAGEVTSEANRRLEGLLAADDRELQRQKSGLLRLLDLEEQDSERLHLLARLREIARALNDRDLVEQASLQQLELAYSLSGADEHRDTAISTLRDLLAEKGEFARIVELYEGLAARAKDPARAGRILADAAAVAWHGLRSAKTCAAIIARAMERGPIAGIEDLLADLCRVAEGDDLQAAYEELRAIDGRSCPPSLGIGLAELATRVGKHEEAATMLQAVLTQPLAPELELPALLTLDAALARAGQPHDRVRALERALSVAQLGNSNRLVEVAAETATLQHVLGRIDQALDSCRIGLTHDPDHKGLLRLHAEMLEQREAWSDLVVALEHLAQASFEDREQAMWLTRAARVHLDHPNLAGGGKNAMQAAHKLLTRARFASPESDDPRTVLLPLAFAESRWDEVLEVAGELRTISGEDSEVLVLAALAEALDRGARDLARAVGCRHDGNVRQRLLWPGLRHVLERVAVDGPLPRLDALLSAAILLCGSPRVLLEELQHWTSGQPLHAGLALGLARLHEARGHAGLARSLYQIAAFMAPTGSVPALVDRLPDPDPPSDPLQVSEWSPLEHRGALRAILIRLRAALAGLREDGGSTAVPASDHERAMIAAAGRIVSPWREKLGLLLPLSLTHDRLADLVAIRNYEEPTIVICPQAVTLSLAELRFRLARAAAIAAMGMAGVRDTDPIRLDDLLDALGQLVNPAHQPTGRGAQKIADAIAARGLRAADLPLETRRALAQELLHWLSDAGAIRRLDVVLCRSELLLANGLSGRLDGALLALARDQGFMRSGQADCAAVLRSDPAHWLLRALGLY